MRISKAFTGAEVQDLNVFGLRVDLWNVCENKGAYGGEGGSW